MLSAKRESLAGKLLLSSALVAVSLAYGWWQTPVAQGPALAMAPAAAPPKTIAPEAPATPVEPVTQDAAPVVKDAPVEAAAPPPEKFAAIAKPQTVAPTATPAPPEPQQTTDLAPPSAALTKQQAMQMNLPTDGASPPVPLVTGAPEPGAAAAVPAGMHLVDGDFVSDRHELSWGDLRVQISIQGGVIAGVQVLQFPDHRSQSLYLSQMALPTLESEVIKSQKSAVDVVSSATDTSYTFQDAVADAITKATRG